LFTLKGSNPDSAATAEAPLQVSKDKFSRGVLQTLNDAANTANTKDLEYLVNCGENIDAKASIVGQAPIHKAVLSTKTLEAKAATLERIFKCKADVNMLDSNGWTALHHAAFNGDLTSVDQLLVQHANVDSFSNQYKTPLHFAALNNHAHVVASLLESGCNPEAKDEQQCTPLHLACKKGGQECLELLLRRGANLMAPDNRQWTALHYAAYNGHPRAANFLLKWEADDDKLSFVKNSQGRTAFIIAKDDRVKKAFNRKYTRHLHMITLSIFYRHLEIQ